MEPTLFPAGAYARQIRPDQFPLADGVASRTNALEYFFADLSSLAVLNRHQPNDTHKNP
jgi:hypothetical protein